MRKGCDRVFDLLREFNKKPIARYDHQTFVEDLFCFFLFVFVAEANRRPSQQQRRPGAAQTANRRAAQQRQELRPQCQSGIARTSIYYVPLEEDICGEVPRCDRFIQRVEVQGSGWLRNGQLLRYDGRIEDPRGCTTARGGVGTCLTTYISIAADADSIVWVI